MLFSAGVTGSFTDCIFLLCLKDIHNELHLPSLHLPCLSAFVLRSMPMSIFSALLAQELFFCTVWISGYSLISFHSSVFMLTFFFWFSWDSYCLTAFITSGYRIIYSPCILSFLLKFTQCYLYFCLNLLCCNLTFHYYSYQQSVIYKVQK